MSLVPLLMLLMAHGLDSRSNPNNFQRRQGPRSCKIYDIFSKFYFFSGTLASYGLGAPSIPSYNGGGGQPSYNGGQGGSKRPKSITIPLPDFDVGQIIREKQNILGSVVNIKKILLSPGGDVGDDGGDVGDDGGDVGDDGGDGGDDGGDVGDDGGEHQEDPSLPSAWDRQADRGHQAQPHSSSPRPHHRPEKNWSWLLERSHRPEDRLAGQHLLLRGWWRRCRIWGPSTKLWSTKRVEATTKLPSKMTTITY